MISSALRTFFPRVAAQPVLYNTLGFVQSFAPFYHSHSCSFTPLHTWPGHTETEPHDHTRFRLQKSALRYSRHKEEPPEHWDPIKKKHRILLPIIHYSGPDNAGRPGHWHSSKNASDATSFKQKRTPLHLFIVFPSIQRINKTNGHPQLCKIHRP
jgi:hypothetical protein